MPACDDCLPLAAASIDVETQGKGVHISKCGFPQFTEPAEGELPKIYRTYTYFRRGLEDPEHPEDSVPDCNASFTYAVDEYPCDGTRGSDPEDCDSGASFGDFDCDVTPTVESCSDDAGVFGSFTLSAEFTTEELTDLAVAKLAALPMTSGGNAHRFLETDETALELAVFQWRITHPPTPTCYLKVWLDLTTTVEAGIVEGEMTYETTTEPVRYTWEGSGDPCFGSAASAAELIEGAWSETISYPAAVNGVISIAINKLSLVPGFTPEDGDTRGYPL